MENIKNFAKVTTSMLERIPTSWNWDEVTGPKKERLISQEEAFTFLESFFEDEAFQKEHNFHPIDESQIIALRKEAIRKRKNVFIVKVKSQYYYCITLNKYNAIFSRYHLCSNCARCTALPTAEGGCSKVLDMSLSQSFFTDENKIFHRFDFKNAKRIEKYPAIIAGVESVGIYSEKSGKFLQCKDERMFIFHCKNFTSLSREAPKSTFELNLK